MDPKNEQVVLASNSICSKGEDLQKWSAVSYSHSQFQGTWRLSIILIYEAVRIKLALRLRLCGGVLLALT
jgi:hypothetical protein